MFARTYFLLLLLFSSSFSWAGVSRVGTSSIGSPIEGFETPLPRHYPITQPRENLLALVAPGSGSIDKSTDILAYTVRQFIPEWKGYTRDQWVEQLENFSNFIDFIDNEDACVLAARWVNSKNQVFGLATWGQGKGVIFSSSGTSLTWKATEDLLKNLQLTQGACAWN